ncbi:hypothetical protein GCM10009422_01130 [Brevundimonas kwangchunensis]|uniref:DUF4350 domain-containing protein n=1 Tax=Brevundimonas kwangchunensis TaxID=322163 RepID=A0ABN1GEW8_9CAUL
MQTIDGRYAGFAALVRADGYRIRAGEQKLDQPGALDGVDVLVLSNAVAPRDGSSPDAFSPAEIAAVDAWVRAGGSLLLAVDHAPYGGANETLGRALGVEMGKGYAFEVDARGRPNTNLDYPAEALGDHPVFRGRTADERVERVRTFTGQSLRGPAGATVLLHMTDGAREAADVRTLQQIHQRLDAGEDAGTVFGELSRPALPAQGLAFDHGAGRVVVLGEAGMLTAQMVQYDDGREPFRFGLHTEGHDDQQFALNILHWLSRLEGPQ